MPDAAPTIATVLRSVGYTTGQFGKNHLGDLNKYLPCLHGFDEFFGTSIISMQWRIRSGTRTRLS
jgi:arylsulfatase